MSNRYAIIENGIVINTAVANSDFATEQGWVIIPDDAGIGWAWDGSEFVAPTPDIDAAWAEIRTKRNELLAACDWTQLPDAPVNSLPWAIYRQALRDITEQTDPFNIMWPQEPE